MLKLFIPVLVLLLVLKGGFCQNKVLIHSRDSSSMAFYERLPKLKAAVAAKCNGKIELAFGYLPDNLEEYDAIFTDLWFYDPDSIEFMQAVVDRLTQYLQTKGNVYFELHSRSFILHATRFPDFSDLIGYLGNAFPQISRQAIQSIEGIDGFFTKGMFEKHRGDSVTLGSGYNILGDVQPILKTNITPVVYLAWQHQRENRKVVYHWPYIDDHYEEFIGRVICDYFGLCNPLEVAPSQTIGCHISFDPISNSIHVENASPTASVELYSVLGVRLLNTQAGGGVVKMPHLPRGSYFLVVRENARQIVTTSIMM